jgi:hypothetical protein
MNRETTHRIAHRVLFVTAWAIGVASLSSLDHAQADEAETIQKE